MPLRNIANHLDKGLGSAICGKHYYTARARTAPLQLPKWNRIRPHGHPFQGQIACDCKCADSGRPEAYGERQVDRGIGEEKHPNRGVRPAQHPGQCQVRKRKARNHEQGEVVNVLVWAQYERRRDRQREVQPRLVWPPTE